MTISQIPPVVRLMRERLPGVEVVTWTENPAAGSVLIGLRVSLGRCGCGLPFVATEYAALDLFDIVRARDETAAMQLIVSAIATAAARAAVRAGFCR